MVERRCPGTQDARGSGKAVSRGHGVCILRSNMLNGPAAANGRWANDTRRNRRPTRSADSRQAYAAVHIIWPGQALLASRSSVGSETQPCWPSRRNLGDHGGSPYSRQPTPCSLITNQALTPRYCRKRARHFALARKTQSWVSGATSCTEPSAVVGSSVDWPVRGS